MPGGLMQMVAYGAQDIYLTGNPQITFFRLVYRRYTNFAIESINIPFNTTPTLNNNLENNIIASFPRTGDLIQQVYLEIYLPILNNTPPLTPASNRYCYGVGNAIIKKAIITIGGQIIDRHYGDWMDIWTELSIPAAKRNGYDDMVGNHLDGTYATDNGIRVYVPLQFWFNRNPGLALPLIALQYHEVQLQIYLNPLSSLINYGTFSSNPQPFYFKLYADYIFLDTDERRKFSQMSHEYLIEQLQFTGDQNVESNIYSKTFNLYFNHPVKELIWVHRKNGNLIPIAANGYNPHFNFSLFTNGVNQHTDSFINGKLQLNSQDRFEIRYADYFRKVQNIEHHTQVPRTLRELITNPVYTNYATGYRDQFIYTYSFAYNPEEHQPSGTCNFSRIDKAVMILNYPGTQDNCSFKIFAVNYNVLRIMAGMGGLAYSN